jgi:hypothetical protein
MNCHECEELLQRQLDGEILTGPELDRHLAECSNCRGLFAAGQLLLSGLRRLPSPVPPEGLTSKIVSRVVHDRLSHRRLRWGVGVAMAAACLLFMVWVYNNREPENTSNAKLLNVAKADEVDPQKGNDKKIDQSIQQTQHGLDRLTVDMIDKSRKDAGAKLDAIVVLEMPRIDQSRDRTDIRLARHRSGMTLGLQTVAATTRRGLDFMLRDTPALPNDRNNEE